jgi:DNA polymerase-3 subunit alpha
MTKRDNKPMAFGDLEDETGKIGWTAFPNVYARSSHVLVKDGFVLMEGKFQTDDRGKKFMPDTICKLEGLLSEECEFLVLALDIENFGQDKQKKLKDLLLEYPGKSNILFKLLRENEAETILARSVCVSVNSELLKKLSVMLGKENISIELKRK